MTRDSPTSERSRAHERFVPAGGARECRRSLGGLPHECARVQTLRFCADLRSADLGIRLPVSRISPRVAIARALLRRPRLLLLDEATSQLDAVNEAALRETVAEAARTTTVLVVAHRLSTVTMADRIVVMDAGRVRAVGTHAELVATDPLYGELAATQFLATAG